MARKKIEVTEASLRAQWKWKKVETPRNWNPREVGEELVGYFGGRSLRNGIHGQYEVVVLHVPYRGAFMISGTEIIQKIDAAQVGAGHPMRVVWLGKEDVGRGFEKKRFDVLVAEGPILSADDLPEVELPS